MLNARQLAQLRQEPAEPNRVKAAIRIAGVTQEVVSGATRIPQSNLSRIANSASGQITVQTAARLARYFGCQIPDLFPREASAEAVA